MSKKLLRMILTALFAALTCVSTMVIQIPVPPMGYLHFGDCFVLLSGWVLGPVYGALAAGIGSALADLLTGYALYAPATLLIKAAVALTAALLFRLLRRALGQKPVHTLITCLASSIPAELLMVGGYFGFDWLVLGNALAAVLGSIPSNIVQAASGVIAGTVLFTLLTRLHLLDRFRE